MVSALELSATVADVTMGFSSTADGMNSVDWHTVYCTSNKLQVFQQSMNVLPNRDVYTIKDVFEITVSYCYYSLIGIIFDFRKRWVLIVKTFTVNVLSVYPGLMDIKFWSVLFPKKNDDSMKWRFDQGHAYSAFLIQITQRIEWNMFPVNVLSSMKMKISVLVWSSPTGIVPTSDVRSPEIFVFSLDAYFSSGQ